MSEYQYYEFAAIDRPLTRPEMAELRAVSSRADITPSGFTNHYEWGDLKADPADWMRRYFDAFIYTANWCSCRLALRLPLATFGKAELTPFTTSHALTVDAGDDHWIFYWSLDESENQDRFGMEDGSGWMRRLAPLRDELLRGDLRPLYLGWLAGATGGEIRDDALEPELPPGLSALSPPQQALAEFLEIDSDMLAAAATGSANASRADVAELDRIDEWVGEWQRDEMVVVLKLIAQGRAHDAERRVKSSHAAWLKARRPSRVCTTSQRSVAELRELAKSASGMRLEREAKERATQEAERHRQREAYLRLLMANVDKRWDAIHEQAQRGSASGYEQATRALAELSDGYALTASRETFDHALRRFLVRHATRPALLRRLSEAGIWSG